MAPPRPPTAKKTRHRVRSVSPDVNSLPSSDTNNLKSNITTLPNELLMPIARHLAFDKAEAYLDSVSFQGYIQCQKDLRNLCLVSKQMGAVARQFLYRAIIVKNSDVLVYLARTLDASPGLGHLVKQLVFEVPFELENVQYRKPYVGVLGSSPNYASICQIAIEALDATSYEAHRLRYREICGVESSLAFREWAWIKECDILCQLHCDILLRLSNLELLCFGMLARETGNTLRACGSSLLEALGPDNGQGRESQHVPGFHSKLRHLRLLGDNRGGKWPCSGFHLTRFLQIPSIQVLECVRDDGDVYQLGPRQFIAPMATLSSWQCANITCLDFQQSACTPAAIFRLCETFPCLKYFSVSVERGIPAKSYSEQHVEGFGTREFVSTGLGKLKHLRELKLDLHYGHNIKSLLGEHGVLSLGGLNDLTNLRLPLYSLVEAQTGNEPRVTDLAVVLPPSVEHLTVWAGLDCVRNWDKGPSRTLFSPGPPPTPGVSYHPRESALEFMDSVCGLLTSHFKHLREAVYCYGGQDLDTPCQCDSDTLCSRCEALQLLDLEATEDSATRMGTLASFSEARGVSLRALEEKIEE